MNPLPDEDLLPADYQGWNHSSQIFDRLVREVDPTDVIEVGTWKGMSAIRLHNAMRAIKLPVAGKDWRLWCCDTWLGGIEHMEGEAFGGLFRTQYGYPQLYRQFLSNMQHAGCLEHLRTVPNTSVNCARWLLRRGVRAQLIYVDGSHETPDVHQDVSGFWKLLEPGGIMFGDDWSYGPVCSDVSVFARANPKAVLEVVEGNYWVLRHAR